MPQAVSCSASVSLSKGQVYFPESWALVPADLISVQTLSVTEIPAGCNGTRGSRTAPFAWRSEHVLARWAKYLISTAEGSAGDISWNALSPQPHGKMTWRIKTQPCVDVFVLGGMFHKRTACRMVGWCARGTQRSLCFHLPSHTPISLGHWGCRKGWHASVSAATSQLKTQPHHTSVVFMMRGIQCGEAAEILHNLGNWALVSYPWANYCLCGCLRGSSMSSNVNQRRGGFSPLVTRARMKDLCTQHQK